MNAHQTPGMGDYQYAPILSTADPRVFDAADESHTAQDYAEVFAELEAFIAAGKIAVIGFDQSKIRAALDEIRCRCDEVLECEE